MNSTPPITQNPPAQHQASTSPTRKGNQQSKLTKRLSQKKAGKGAQWDKWQKYMTEPEPKKGTLTGWGAPLPSTGTVFEFSRTQPGHINVLQYGDSIIEDTTGKFTEVCDHIIAHPEEFFAFHQAELNKDFNNDE